MAMVKYEKEQLAVIGVPESVTPRPASFANHVRDDMNTAREHFVATRSAPSYLVVAGSTVHGVGNTDTESCYLNFSITTPIAWPPVYHENRNGGLL